MPRRLRIATAGLVYHVLNRAAKRMTLFATACDYDAFLRVLADAKARFPISLYAFCLMPNHWHFIICPQTDEALSQFMHWLTVTHAQRWHAFHGTSGTGSVYQGRFKAIAVQSDEHLLRVCRYVARNPLRAMLVERAQDWQWSSHSTTRSWSDQLVDPWPIQKPTGWEALVQMPATHAETEAIRSAIRRGAPFGQPDWTSETASKLGLQSTLRPAHRPKKDSRPPYT
jgi:putative transposase